MSNNAYCIFVVKAQADKERMLLESNESEIRRTTGTHRLRKPS